MFQFKYFFFQGSHFTFTRLREGLRRAQHEF
jgi:hypothetical protein